MRCNSNCNMSRRRFEMFSKIKQYLWCSWIHDRYKCWPRVDLPKEESDKIWHCMKCHPCSERLLKWLEEENKDLKRN